MRKAQINLPTDVNSDYKATNDERRWYVTTVKKMRRQRWRLNNLYQIVGESGEIIRFKMRYAQKLLYLGMHYLNLILKSRQPGITTFICLLFFA